MTIEDSRGDAGYNQELSHQRALTIKTQVESLQPSLLYKLAAEGRGEANRVDTGTTERELNHFISV